ncbi:CDP-diacylglycerol--serine O-phosphatidyltransferase [Clostridium botulinum]|nr:CDP-diacylglycerol--serine O-phosphatidyltransferase [Clostridium botulinum]MCS4454214.1 CDP-diacylglycerol--serine O-phosphatidyltransferase [Clostridium botulinum]MCS4468839.1 CDP-diacylglycerol--serine O-phosphatidyltransferase [Clostridium botulinum]MCS4478385.1 CDP-diacylglycerol--serine O-phosphatidyltransferase [Clostridium botulinum]MCS4480154.1 CDP-diacylglycerol--serine O-phosphatidyltransferase [Clostridium botulinum]MCS4483014.1 CDP-diacylglycerol--serine O-phosphatidyltransfera
MAKIAKSAVPNAFTLGNLGCGVMSLMMTFQQNYKWAALFILIAGLMDRYDGRVARLLKVDSAIGKELDSLADLVSFGVAPSILTFHIYNFSYLGILGYLLVLMFPIAGAYRLARYNITEFDGSFSGIPITLAGMFMAIYCLISSNKIGTSGLTIILMITLSYLMVSNVKLKNFKKSWFSTIFLLLIT